MSFSSAPAAAVQALADLLSAPRRIAITTHYNPDGDALGSSLGLAHVLKALGHTVQVVLPNTPPYNLQWMSGYQDTLAHDKAKEVSEAALLGAEVVFCLDFNKQDRVYGLEQTLQAVQVKVLIDHHRDPDNFAVVAFSDITACATCQMVYDIVDALGHADRITADAANCLYAGIMTDSGSFRFASTTPHTLQVAAHLMERGAVPDRIHSAIMDDNSESRLRLLGYTLSERMSVYPEMCTAVFALSKADTDRFQFAPGDTEGLVNFGLSMRGIRLSAFFIQRNDIIKISLRSKGDLPVNEFLSAHFEGGGHANASGGQSREPLEATMAKFMRELPAFLAKHPA